MRTQLGPRGIDTVVVGASAGGVETLSQLVGLLGRDFPASVLMVLHVSQNSPSALPQILRRHTPLPVSHAEDREIALPGHIYLAPPSRHMLLRGSIIELVDGPKENGNRPAIDPLFRSAAESRGSSVAGVLLSGLLDDGTLGMLAIKRQGGATIVQSPDEALFGDMPRNAIVNVGVEHVLPLREIGALLTRLAELGSSEPAREVGEPDPVSMTAEELARHESLGRPSAFVCPECQGTLFELNDEGVLRYRCRVGHAYTQETLVSEQSSALEEALWTALRALEEHNALLERMLARAEERGYNHSAKQYRLQLELGRERTHLIRSALRQESNAVRH